MAKHFLLSRAAKTLSLAQVFRMTDGEAETTFKALRWADAEASYRKALADRPGHPQAQRGLRAALAAQNKT